MCKPTDVDKFNKKFRDDADKLLKSRSKKEIKEFLMGAGILTTRGKLRKIYSQN
jgi:hypothetical protein